MATMLSAVASGSRLVQATASRGHVLRSTAAPVTRRARLSLSRTAAVQQCLPEVPRASRFLHTSKKSSLNPSPSLPSSGPSEDLENSFKGEFRPGAPQRVADRRRPIVSVRVSDTSRDSQARRASAVNHPAFAAVMEGPGALRPGTRTCPNRRNYPVLRELRASQGHEPAPDLLFPVWKVLLSRTINARTDRSIELSPERTVPLRLGRDRQDDAHGPLPPDPA